MNVNSTVSKVPAVTLGFWAIKIAATTLGETGGDTVSMTWKMGYLAGTAIFLSTLVVLVILQIVAKKFHPFLYWATIIASTTAGTTMADYADRSLGIGYTGGSALLLACVLASLAVWFWSEKTVSVTTVNTPRVGTALGDWTADGIDQYHDGWGFIGGAVLFGGVLAVVAALYFWSKISKVLLFWADFILTRPLGATVGDFLDKPLHDGGLNLSRPIATLVLAAFILAGILLLPQRAGEHPKKAET